MEVQELGENAAQRKKKLPHNPLRRRERYDNVAARGSRCTTGRISVAETRTRMVRAPLAVDVSGKGDDVGRKGAARRVVEQHADVSVAICSHAHADVEGCPVAGSAGRRLAVPDARVGNA